MSSSTDDRALAEAVAEACRVVTKLTGIQLGARQDAMVRSRLARRMLDLGMTATQYVAHLKTGGREESSALVSLLTTHHTFFFREFGHFEFLGEKLPRLVAAARARGSRTLRIWSAACSRGQEVYSLSMFLHQRLRDVAPDFTFEILGTDVDPESVGIARNGVYLWDELKSAPAAFLAGHWKRGTAEISAFVKALPMIREPCRFSVLNLHDLAGAASGASPAAALHGKFDVIFCRNVMIYFSPGQIRALAARLLDRLQPEGYLFVGISESLINMELPLSYAGPSVYEHVSASPKPESVPARASAAASARAPVPMAPLRVICVDDSPVILSMLRKILSAEPGFEVVATAANGHEAAEALRKHPADAMTLDIHMPGQTGLEYLRANYGPTHPPVVMVTSVSREDTELGLACLRAGARDFVEKPALKDMEARGDELRMKLRCVVRSARVATEAARGGILEITSSFARAPKIAVPERKLRVLIGTPAERERLLAVLRQISTTDPVATLLLLAGAPELLSEVASDLQASSAHPLRVAPPQAGLLPEAGRILVAELGEGLAAIEQLPPQRRARVSIGVTGDVTDAMERRIQLSLTRLGAGAQLITDDCAGGFSAAHRRLQGSATEQIPITGFLYASCQFLGRDVSP